MNDRKRAACGGQNKTVLSGANSTHMEDRNMLRQMERERRNQEVQQVETQYDRISPLFSEPYKIIKGDALSTRIQRMLGNFEVGYDAGPRELCSVFPYGHSTQFNLHNPSGHMDAHESLPTSSGSLQKGENRNSNSLPVLSPPVDPLSPLQASDVEDLSPEPCPVEPSQMEAPPLAHSLPLNLRSKPGLVNPKKPTAYVRPMDGQDQMSGDSPELKASSETCESDLKNVSISPRVPLLKLQQQSVDIGCHVEDILKEMTSWPELVTAIHTPSTRETLKFLNPNPTHKGSSVEQEQQGSIVSSNLANSSSDSDNSSSPEIPPAAENAHLPHTQAEKRNDWQLGRWLQMKENQKNPESPCDISDIIRSDSVDSPGWTETINPTHVDTETVSSAHIKDFQHHRNKSTHREKPNRNKGERHTEQRRASTESKAQEVSVCIPKHTETKYIQRPLLVKIELNLLSRIPKEPKAAQLCSRRPDVQKNTSDGVCGRKRPVKQVEKTQRKKQKIGKEQEQSSSSQNTISQSEATRSCKPMKESVKRLHRPLRDVGHRFHPVVPPDSQQKNAKEMCTCAAKPRPLLQSDCRQHSVEDHVKEAKKLKHEADATLDKMSKALTYLEAALSFVESGVAMETDPQTPKSAYTMFSETVDLIRFILKLKNYTDTAAAAHERDFLVLCLRCQSLLQMTMFRHRRYSALKYSRALSDHFKSVCPVNSSSTVVIPQSIQQVATSYVNITALFLNAHETWEQAEELALTGSGLLQELDCVVGPLNLMSSISSLVPYIRQGLHWIRLDTLNSR